jgi:hypothetical protein
MIKRPARMISRDLGDGAVYRGSLLCCAHDIVVCPSPGNPAPSRG